MAEKCHTFLFGLIIVCSFLTGTSGAEVTHVFSSSGESVRLPCNEALSGCTSTTWISTRQSGTVELVTLGIKRNDRERHETLSLGSDCSLNIEKVTQEDYGLYTCRQYVNERPHGTDETVYLHFLHVSSSSSHTDLRPVSVTLSCQLYSYNFPCDALVRTEGIQLVWMKAGVNLQRDSRYQISFSSTQTHCISTLTTTLLNEDLSRDLRCQVTQRNELKTSATFTVKDSAPPETKTRTPVTSSKTTSSEVTSAQPVSATSALILANTSNSEQMRPKATTPPEKLVTVIVGVVGAMAVLLSVAIFCVVCKKRGAYSSDNRRGTNDSVDTNMNKYNGTNDTANISIHRSSSANEQKDVIYTEVATYSKNQAKKNKVHGDEVTYASIRGATAEPQENCSQLYASVNKNHHK